ncbi:MAG: DNA primase [Candidatus Berkelbacteria bacterium]|nr:DNA primase [Candidatus Berkelbacteria bacterium]
MNEVEEIKNKIDIVDLVGGYLTLKKAGVNYKGLCPFHNEKTPSFMVSAERQSFKCFGCGKGGDVFTFIEEIEGMDFYDSLKLLAGKAGVELKQKSGLKYAGREVAPTEKSKIYDINDLAAKLYHKLLIDHPKAQYARKYLRDRGISEKTILDWRIGYAPKTWDLLIKFLAAKGFNEKDIFKAGLLVLGEKGKYWDRFRGRIMFPISNISGQVVAFTGRVLEDDPKAAKYVNSAESPIYIKGKTIYALDRARIDIRAQNCALLVEGQMDALACHQAGFKNVVAVSGTALTQDQLKILARYSPNIVFSFDSDTAGKTALKRAITMAMQNDINAKVLSLPGFKDPDEAIKSDVKNFEVAIKSAKPALEHWIDSLVLELGITDVAAKKTISKEILPVIKIISNDIEKEHYSKYLAKKLAMSETAIIGQLDKTKGNIEESRNQGIDRSKLTYEQRVAGLVWQEKKLADKIPKNFFDLNFQDEAAETFFESIKSNIDYQKLPVEVKSKLDLYAFEATKELDLDEEDIINKEFDSLLRTYVDKKRELVKIDFAQQIAAAEAAGDREKIKELMRELQSAIVDK